MLWHKIPRYRLGKTPGSAVILFERGYWGDDPYCDYHYNPPFHKHGKSLMHQNGRVHFVKGKLLEQLFDEETVANPTEEHWVNRFHVLDNM